MGHDSRSSVEEYIPRGVGGSAAGWDGRHPNQDEQHDAKMNLPVWNASHGSRGCSQENLVATGGNGYFYCFAVEG
jgi:hypothetical protein